MSGKHNKANDEMKNEWLGMDGFLVLLFIALSIFIGYCVIHNVDIVIGKIIPYGVAAATTVIFIKYIFEVATFSKRKGRKE